MVSYLNPLAVQYRPLDSLKPYEKNSRTHSDAQISQIAASITEFGFTNPVLIDGEGGIIAGHGRVLAAKALGLADVPVLVLDHLTAAQRRAYVIADNKLALNAGWDEDVLRAEIEALGAEDIDLGLLGFDDAELDALLNPPSTSTADPDDVPDAPEAPVSALGDVWLLGGHRIMCGDSTDAETVSRVLAGVKPHLMVTDPPYGVEYDPAWREKAGVAASGTAKGKVLNDDKADWREAWALFPGDVAYVWTNGKFLPESILSLEAAGFERRCLIVWEKSSLVIGRGHYHSQEEECWYAVRKGATGHWHGDRKQTTLWQIDKPRKSETGHSTQKPVECMKRPIENNSSAGQAVYEPFSGSGTTIIAAEMTGRRCLAIELSPAYVDVAVLRWEAFTDRTATLEATGQTFREVADERRLAALEAA